jgi:methyl-accepting chemotaxis protein
MSIKNLMILERSNSSLTSADASEKYVLEGIFGEIDKKNRNQRIYTESEYLPQIEALQAKIKSSKLLGELDHPKEFDVSLKNVSHIIEDLTYDKDSKQVRGRIRLLDTDAGRQAKALVDAGVPLQISSRAAGAVREDGTVQIKQLFTYDLVADPGFENAELKRVNEAYGFENNDTFFIFEIPDNKTNLNQNKTNESTMTSYVNVEDFNSYSKYLAEEIKALKEQLSKVTSDNTTSEMNEKMTGLIAHNDHIVENVKKLSEYVEYVSEKLDQGIQYTEHVAEMTDNNIEYTKYMAEKLDQNISFTEHVAESTAKIKDYSNYLAESLDETVETNKNLRSYVNYLKENVQSISEYAEYIAESFNKNLVVEENGDEAGKEHDEAAKKNELDKVGDNSAEGKVDGEKAGIEGEDVKADLTDKTPEIKTEEGDKDPGKVEGSNATNDVVGAVEAYKSEISAKLSTLIEKATVKANNDPHFFRLVSKETKAKYNALDESAKTAVLKQTEGAGFLTEGQINAIFENVLVEVSTLNNEPYFIQVMPAEYKETWNKLSEGKKSQIAAQSKYAKLETEYQVRNFWQTRDLREYAPVMEKVSMIKEEVETKTNSLPYDMTSITEAINAKFKK